MSKCWICDSKADSAEHKFKKSDFVRLWGKGPYKNDNELLHFKEGNQKFIQGPNSKKVKFEKIICHKCNTTLTQPFDRAYAEFIKFVENNTAEIIHKRMINFQSVYGDDFEEKQRNLFKYYAKCFGCRLADAGRDIPKDIIDLLPKKAFQTGLRVTFHVNEDMALLPNEDQGIGMANLYYIERNPVENTGYFCGHNFKWLNFNYWYLWLPDGQFGASWIADSQYIYLGSHSPLDENMREELIKKIKSRTA